MIYANDLPYSSEETDPLTALHRRSLVSTKSTARMPDPSQISRMVAESDFQPQAVAFALGFCDDNEADAMSLLAELADESSAGA